jgi:hypothetical protein
MRKVASLHISESKLGKKTGHVFHNETSLRAEAPIPADLGIAKDAPDRRACDPLCPAEGPKDEGLLEHQDMTRREEAVAFPDVACASSPSFKQLGWTFSCSQTFCGAISKSSSFVFLRRNSLWVF